MLAMEFILTDNVTLHNQEDTEHSVRYYRLVSWYWFGNYSSFPVFARAARSGSRVQWVEE